MAPVDPVAPAPQCELLGQPGERCERHLSNQGRRELWGGALHNVRLGCSSSSPSLEPGAETVTFHLDATQYHQWHRRDVVGERLAVEAVEGEAQRDVGGGPAGAVDRRLAGQVDGLLVGE